MIIVCAQCKASYLIPASTFATGPRRVRCARCGETWMADLPPKTSAFPFEETPAPPPPEPEATPIVAPVPPPEQPQNLPVIRKKRDWGRWIKWGVRGASAVVAVVLIALLVTFGPLQGIHMPSSPPKAKKVDTLTLQEVTSERRFVDGAMQLVVDGVVYNKTSQKRPIPPLEFKAYGVDGKIMQSWRMDPPAATIEAGASQSFHSVVNTAEGTVVEVNIRFVEQTSDK